MCLALRARVEWLLICYQVPNQPSALRVATWRALKKSGAVLLGPGSYALPDVPTNRAALEQLAERISSGGGSAITFTAAAMTAEDARAIELKAEDARREEYLQVIKSARKFFAHVEQEERDRDYRFAEVESLDEELGKVRRQLHLVIERDSFLLPEREEALSGVRLAEDRLQQYLDNAYREENAE